jgi:Lrp/AsnC family transcriptional regulator, leucine-responsive regulatory protein
MADLDRIDRAIVTALTENARLPLTALAERVGLSKTPCAARLRRLEAAGIVRGYRALIDHRRLGLGHVAFVQVHLADTKSAALDAFDAAVRAIPAVEECHLIAGSFDYLVKVRTEDIDAFRRVLGERISALPNVSHTSSFVAMATVIDRGA